MISRSQCESSYVGAKCYLNHSAHPSESQLQLEKPDKGKPLGKLHFKLPWEHLKDFLKLFMANISIFLVLSHFQLRGIEKLWISCSTVTG